VVSADAGPGPHVVLAGQMVLAKKQELGDTVFKNRASYLASSVRGGNTVKRGLFHSLLLLFVLAAIAPAGENHTQAPILIGNVELSLGMPRDAALAALRAKSNYLLTKTRNSRWVVSDKEAELPVAILTFDQHGRLWQIQKNWTPASDSSAAFAQALYSLAGQMPAEDTGGQSHSCVLSTLQNSYVGPNAWLRDPGQPDLNVREIDLKCPKETIQIYINEPTDVTRSRWQPIIGRALLYESISDPSN
jgi:hypothetical protein